MSRICMAGDCRCRSASHSVSNCTAQHHMSYPEPHKPSTPVHMPNLIPINPNPLLLQLNITCQILNPICMAGDCRCRSASKCGVTECEGERECGEERVGVAKCEGRCEGLTSRARKPITQSVNLDPSTRNPSPPRFCCSQIL